ncbi:MAG: stage II sporulation protein P [Clostridia bacterium]|nr:stage II sporulation protein P [Clostridia bacterium]
MKKYLIITILFLLSIYTFLTPSISYEIINYALPIMKISKNKNIKFLSYMPILKNCIIKEDEKEDIVTTEIIVDEEVEEVIKEENVVNAKEVTLDWQNILKNETKFNVDIDKLKNEKLNFKLNKKDIEVLIYHTHSTECYSKSKGYEYEASGVFRTLNKKVSVIRIGNEIKANLQKYGIGVYHDETLYDYPDYNKSYSNAGKSIPKLLDKYKNVKIVLDVHRDAIGVGTEQYKPVVKINGENVAQFMLVIGTNGGGLKHDAWKENLKLALKIKEKADEKYPGLCRYIILRKERFNQQVTNGAMIVEMGATGNTIPEVINASKYFAEILNDVV